MTHRAKQRNKKSRVRPPVQHRATPPSLFRMVAAANPGPSLSVGSELDLVKAALLYGDKVTLISPVTTMLLRAEGLQQFTPRQLVELLRRVAPTLMPGSELPQFERGLVQVDQLLRTTPRIGLNDQLLRTALHQALEPGQRVLSETVRGIAAQAGIQQLARARREGLVEIESADPGDEMDLLVSCIVSAHLAQTGQQQDNPHTGRVVETFLDKLSRHLSSGREYLTFDEPIANLIEAAIREGIFSPASGPAGRSAQAMAASGLMGRLPTFPTATVDEVLDIRSELAPSLTQFRSAMVAISQNFTSASWEGDFGDKLHDAWVETVHPALEAIEASVRENRSVLALAADYFGAANTAWPGLALVGAGVLGHVDAAQAIGGVLSGVTPLLQVLRDRRKAHTDIRMQPFYFLYKAERALQ